LSNALEFNTGYDKQYYRFADCFQRSTESNGDRDLGLLEDDKIILIELRKALTPFQDLTELVSFEQPLLGSVPLILKEVQDTTKIDPNEADVITTLKAIANNCLSHRIQIAEAVKPGTVLDPTMKHVIQSDTPLSELKTTLMNHRRKLAYERRTRALAATRQSMESTAPDTPKSIRCSRNTHEEAAAPPQQPLSEKMRLTEKFRPDQTVATDIKIESEVNTYLHLTTVNTDENPLMFWQRQQNNFPHLSVPATNYLSISASSVPVDATFSTCGLILNQKRCSRSLYRAMTTI
jgi:hypothetical protein